MAVINGETTEVSGMTLKEYLEAAGYKTERVVVERNLEIVPKEKYAEVFIEADDVIEILNFVGGG